jgi:MFS family permease
MQALEGLRFEWDEYQQNIILGSFFWGYVLTELPGGRLAEIIGGHRVFGYSMLGASILTLLTSAAARLDYIAVVALRVLVGLMLVRCSYIHRCAVVIFVCCCFLLVAVFCVWLFFCV